jgi:hypothetical protein
MFISNAAMPGARYIGTMPMELAVVVSAVAAPANMAGAGAIRRPTMPNDLQQQLADLDRVLDDHGVLKGDDPRGMMVSETELTHRREMEGQSSPVMCSGCGYGLAPADVRCPKCAGSGRETATAFAPRSIDAMLAEHLGRAEPQAKCVAAGKISGKASAAKRKKGKA